MTRKIINDLELSRTRLKTYFKMYKSCAQTIQSELNSANASQKDYVDESEEIRHADEEIEEARSILRLKFLKWKLIKQKDKRDEADRRKVERNKPMLLALQQIQQQMQTDAKTDSSNAPTTNRSGLCSSRSI